MKKCKKRLAALLALVLVLAAPPLSAQTYNQSDRDALALKVEW